MNVSLIKINSCDSVTHNLKVGSSVKCRAVDLPTDINELYRAIQKYYPELLVRTCGCQYKFIDIS